MHSISDRRQVCSRRVEKEGQRKKEEEEKEELVVREDFRERVKDALHLARQGRGEGLSGRGQEQQRQGRVKIQVMFGVLLLEQMVLGIWVPWQGGKARLQKALHARQRSMDLIL